MDIVGISRQNSVYGGCGGAYYASGTSRCCHKLQKERNAGRIVVLGLLLCLLIMVVGVIIGNTVLTEGEISVNTVPAEAEISEMVSTESDFSRNVYEEPLTSDNHLDEEVLSECLTSELHPVIPDTDLVIIDPGHGGEDEGCERDGILEKDINLQLALALREKLTESGFDVILTRDVDKELSVEERIEIANTSDADIFVSIHQNSYEGSEASGIETWYSFDTQRKDSSRLALLLHKYVVQFTQANDRGLVEDEELKVIREVKMPACLVETGFLSNSQERTLLTDADYQMQIVEGLAKGIEYYFYPKTMYLTFDDGPSAENTDAILDILQEQNIKATFFVIGENVRKYPEVARRIVEDGHTIGIHCYNHDYDELYESVDSFVADFEAAFDTVYEVTGAEPQIFRFPGGSINAYNKDVCQEIIAEMSVRGFVYYDWNASLEDAVKKPDPERLLKNAKDSTLGRKKIIMLAHDTVYSTALCLEELIAQFPEYRMEPLSAEVEPIRFRRAE